MFLQKTLTVRVSITVPTAGLQLCYIQRATYFLVWQNPVKLETSCKVKPTPYGEFSMVSASYFAHNEIREKTKIDWNVCWQIFSPLNLNKRVYHVGKLHAN